MTLSANALRIQQLSRENPVIHRALYLVRCEQLTYEQALECAVIELAAQSEVAQKILVEAALRQPAPVWVKPSEPNQCQ